MNRNAVWETWWAENLECLLWYLHKGNWLSANNKNMLVMISPLKSSLPKTRLQEIACRCHGVLLTCIEQVAPGVYSTLLLGQRSCTISCEWHPWSTLHQNSSTFCSFLKNPSPDSQILSQPTFALALYISASWIISVPQTFEIGPTLGSSCLLFYGGERFFLRWSCWHCHFIQVSDGTSLLRENSLNCHRIWFHFCGFWF